MSNTTPQDWLNVTLGINTIQSGGQAVTASPGERTLNIIGAVSVVDNPSNGSTDVTLPTASSAPVTIVELTAGLAQAPTASATHECNAGAGPISVQLPSGAPKGTTYTFKILCTPTSVDYVEIDAPSGGHLELPLGVNGVQVPLTTAASLRFQNASDAGTTYRVYARGDNTFGLY